MSKSLSFLLESSLTPICQRIIDNFRAALTGIGHRVLLVEPGTFEREQDYLAYIKNQSASAPPGRTWQCSRSGTLPGAPGPRNIGNRARAVAETTNGQ